MKINILLISILFLIYCNKKEKINSEQNNILTLVKVKLIEKEKSYNKLDLVGQIESFKKITIYPNKYVSGIIKNKRVKEGNKVNLYQNIMQIYQRSVKNNKHRYIKVRSKLKGIVLKTYVEEGDLVNPNTKLVDIAKINKVKVLIDIHQKNISKITKNQIVYIYSKSYAKEVFQGKINHINSSIDPNTLTLRVEAIINNTTLKLKPGMFVQVEIVLNEVEKILISLDSIIIEDNIKYVYLYNPSTKRVDRKNINTGEIYGDKIEVIKGIKTGNIIVIEGNYQIRDQEKVNIKLVKNYNETKN